MCEATAVVVRFHYKNKTVSGSGADIKYLIKLTAETIYKVTLNILKTNEIIVSEESGRANGIST